MRITMTGLEKSRLLVIRIVGIHIIRDYEIFPVTLCPKSSGANRLQGIPLVVF